MRLSPFVVLVPCVALLACHEPERPLASREHTFAELRTVRRGVLVTAPGEGARDPYARERLVDGEKIEVAEGGLAWLRRDGGATLLVAGPASLTLREDRIDLTNGKVFVEAIGDAKAELGTKLGMLHLVDVRASVVADATSTKAYVLRGAVRTEAGEQASAGELLTVSAGGKVEKTPALAWEDWTGGLATTDATKEPAPYGVGTVGARPPGSLGEARLPLAIQKLDVRVSVDHDYAVTEVDETFFNPTAQTVEGIYRFRTPPAASLHRFGVDRDGAIVWGRVKEQAAAAAQYQSNVYAGSTEDPALLEWDGTGVYKARLYPIPPGGVRRVVTRYAEWLGRQGDKGERRLYVYPMAAEGAEGVLPRIEELTVDIDLSRAGAREVRAGMDGHREGDHVVVRGFDLTPRADLALELFDDGEKVTTAYRAPHTLDLETMSPEDRQRAPELAKGESDYILVPVRPTKIAEPKGGLDLAIVVDTSAATDRAALSVARAATTAILSHLGKDDRAAVWAADATLRPIAPGSDKLAVVDEARREAIAEGLAKADRGGATDLGAVLAQAASALPEGRRGAVVYIGDGRPTVGELAIADLRTRLSRLAHPVRVYALGAGDDSNMSVLGGIARAGFAERVSDGQSAARAALRLLEEAERPAWLGATVDLGPTVERIYPRDIGALLADETAIVVGRLTGAPPKSVTLRGTGGTASRDVVTRPLADDGDLRRRWGEGRLIELLDEGAGRAAVVEVGTRYGVITPFSSLYVPTTKELATERQKYPQEVADEEKPDEDDGPSWFRSKRDAVAEREEEAAADNKEGGTGTRAKGEEGSMGNPNTTTTGKRYAVQGPADNAKMEAQEFGIIGLLDAAPNAPAAPWGRDDSGGKDRPMAAAPMASAMAMPVTVAPALAAKLAPPAAKAPPSGPKKWAFTPGGGGPTAPQADASVAQNPYGGTTADPSSGAADALSARGNVWGDAIGDSFGAGGLGLSGIGEGGGGLAKTGEGIGLGSIGTIGHGSAGEGQGFGNGHGRLGGAHMQKPPSVRIGGVQVSGRLPIEVVTRIYRQNLGRMRLCYENGLRSNPNLQGRVSTRLVIGNDGSVSSAANAGSDLPDAGVVACVLRAANGLSFPQPEGGVVTAVIPVSFSPDGGSADDAKTDAAATAAIAATQAKNLDDSVLAAMLPKMPAVRAGDVAHVVFRCDASAALPLEERVALWRERMAKAGTSGRAFAELYRAALARCEAPTWRERSRLLTVLVDGLPSQPARVDLWRSVGATSTAGDVVYRAILARVRTASDVRSLHDALGLRTMSAPLLAQALKKAANANERALVLRDLVKVWPDDLEVALALLDAYEDSGDVGAGRTFARSLRVRGDANARVRTAVGEYYLRLSKNAKAGGTDEDVAEARRTFGEIVEFNPEDPVARRRLGDLLRAHGWYEEAQRQYETLAQLAPDDATVPLLLAASSFGLGKVEEAIRWTEKASAGSAPDGESGSGKTARAFARVFLAWSRDEAAKAGKTEDAKLLRDRAKRISAPDQPSADSTRVVVTWSHPELHPVLWTNALGAVMPAPDGDALLGLAQATLPAAKSDAVVELHLEPDDAARAARLGAEAIVTCITDEGEADEKIAVLHVTFASGAATVTKLAIANGAATQVSQ